MQPEIFWFEILIDFDVFLTLTFSYLVGRGSQQVLEIEENVDWSPERLKVEISLELELAAIVSLPLALRHESPEQDGQDVGLRDQVVRKSGNREKL